MATIVQPTIAPAASVSVADASLPFPDGKRILWAYIPGNTAYFLDNTGTKWVDVKALDVPPGGAPCPADNAKMVWILGGSSDGCTIQSATTGRYLEWVYPAGSGSPSVTTSESAKNTTTWRLWPVDNDGTADKAHSYAITPPNHSRFPLAWGSDKAGVARLAEGLMAHPWTVAKEWPA